MSLLSNNQKVSSIAGKLTENGYVIFKTAKECIADFVKSLTNDRLEEIHGIVKRV